jgi:hypothetical protein
MMVQGVIYDFYKKLFGSRMKSTVGMADDAWRVRGRLTQEDNDEILKPFSIE